MTESEFAKGMKVIETAMQGVPDERDARGKVTKTGTSFTHEFLDYLFKQVKGTSAEIWNCVVERLARTPCKPRDLTVASFFQEIDIYNEQQKWVKSRWKMTPDRPLPNLKIVYERVLDDPAANESAKALARQGLVRLERAAASGPGEKKKGGEKYRRMKESQA